MNRETDIQNASPSQLSVERLQHHFKSVYKLSDEQVDLMVKSSSTSLTKSMTLLGEAVEKRTGFDDISRHAHSVKGLLLNMGEHHWAEIAREIEKSASAQSEKDYSKLVDTLLNGVKDVLE